MSKRLDKLTEEIRVLPDTEKLRLVDAILTELDTPDPEIDRVWAEEARKRWQAYKEGKVEDVIGVFEMFSDLRDSRARPRGHVRNFFERQIAHATKQVHQHLKGFFMELAIENSLRRQRKGFGHCLDELRRGGPIRLTYCRAT